MQANICNTEGGKKTIAMKEVVSWPLPSQTSLSPHKFDRRTYILIVSYEPLVIFYNRGHLQVSPFEANSVHPKKDITNPHIGEQVTKDFTNYLKPVSVLSDSLVPKVGASSTSDTMECLERATANALLQVFYAFIHEARERFGSLPSAMSQQFGIDVLTDGQLHPYPIDVNAAPGLHHHYPWSVEQT